VRSARRELRSAAPRCSQRLPPPRRLGHALIVKLSANRNYALRAELDAMRELEHFAFFRAAAQRCS
jgi:hypothetical protein